ncbi:hypothetical protein EON83_07600 [bacterium]|nr:MAG: hypothetical protein EON83_07600 [bacterium]
MSTTLRQVKTFRGSNNEALAEEINKWVNFTHAIPYSMTVNDKDGDLCAFVIYELPAEKQRHLGMR